MTFATPNLPASAKAPNDLRITCLNGTMTILQKPNQLWNVKIVGAEGSDVKEVEKESKASGVEVEIAVFARAVAERKEGKQASEENYGEPRDAMWDLALIQAFLTSDGKEVILDNLLNGQ